MEEVSLPSAVKSPTNHQLEKEDAVFIWVQFGLQEAEIQIRSYNITVTELKRQIYNSQQFGNWPGDASTLEIYLLR